LQYSLDLFFVYLFVLYNIKIYVSVDKRGSASPRLPTGRVGIVGGLGLNRAGLTIWWALRTPQRRGPTGKLDAEEGERGGEGCPLPNQLGVSGALYKLLGGVRGAENGFGEI